MNAIKAAKNSVASEAKEAKAYEVADGHSAKKIMDNTTPTQKQGHLYLHWFQVKWTR